MALILDVPDSAADVDRELLTWVAGLALSENKTKDEIKAGVRNAVLAAVPIGAPISAITSVANGIRALRSRISKITNPFGKLGSPAHRAKVSQVANDIRSRGLQARTEVPIGTVNGQKAVRYMDVVAIDPKTGQIVEVHQIGRVLKTNAKVPISRERAALRDVRCSPEVRGAKRVFHGY